MSYPKIAKLVEILINKTAAGELAWESTAIADVFQVAFPRYSVRILTAEGRGGLDIVLQVVNDQGEIVEAVSDPQLSGYLDNPFSKMQELHNSARRIAMGVEEALDDLIDFLDPEIPF